MDKVSIVVPIYGVEQYIERCVRSLFEQTYLDLEFVFVNDCTPDRSMEFLLKVMDDYPERREAVKIINHEKNQGLAASRNTGLDNSIGKFVCCVDSDDWLELDAIELLEKKQLESESDIVSGNYLIHYEDEERLWPMRNYLNKEQMVLGMMQRTWDHFVAGRLVRRSLFVDNGLRWNEGFDVAEDRYMMTLLAYHSNSFASINEIVYHYDRRNTNAITCSGDKDKVFRNNRQELNNLLLLEQHFEGKETAYQKECARCVMEQLEYNLQAALAHSSKKEFDEIVDIIKARSNDDMELIGWERNSLIGRLRFGYGFMKLGRIHGRAKRYLKKRFKS